MYPESQILPRQRRQPWDERLPDGTPALSVATPRERVLELLRRTPVNSPTEVPATIISPRPTQPIPYPGIASESEAAATRPWKVGGSLETDPLKRDAARIRAMIENPMSKVSQSGVVETPHPMGRLKAALLGGLFGLAQGGPDTPLAARLAGGAAGAGIGVADPRKVQEWRRRMEVEDEQGRLAQQIKLAGGQAQLESEQAETRQRQLAPEIALIDAERKARYDRERLDIQRKVAEGRVSVEEANRELRRLELEERKRHNLETEDIQRTRPASGEAQAAEGEAIAESTQTAADSLKSEIDQHKTQLLENERAIREKSAWLKRRTAEILASDEELKAMAAMGGTSAAEARKAAEDKARLEDPDVANGTFDQTVSNTESLKTAIAEKEKRYNSMQEDIRKGRAKGARVRATSEGQGRKWSASKWAADPRNEGKDVAAAKAAARAAGYTVVE